MTASLSIPGTWPAQSIQAHLSGPSPKKQPCRGGKREQRCKLEIVMHPIALGALFALQCFHVLFLALHDWIPLGTFNDAKSVREVNPVRKMIAATLIRLIPFAIGLAASAVYFGRALRRGCSGGSGSATAFYLLAS
jgi:hypothetical protein